MPESDRLLTVRDVIARTAIGRTRLYEMIRCGDFPAPHKIGTKLSRWKASEVDRWIDSLGADPDERAAA